MGLVELERRFVLKPWGRADVDPFWGWSGAPGERLGEIWFVDPAYDDSPLLLKYLFTSERLSIQVHPGDQAARKAGHRRGKDEAWLVLAADPGAEIGFGLTRRIAADDLRAAAISGGIEALIDWRKVTAGEILYSPAGTIHALGAGLVVLEIQQNLDLTYRLYDYGRPRELHLDAALEVASLAPAAPGPRPEICVPGQERFEGPAFTLERRRIGGTLDPPTGIAWLAPLANGITFDGRPAAPATVWRATAPVEVGVEPGSELVIAFPGPA